MSTVVQDVPALVAGERLTADEFLRRWDAMPRLKFAELIGGIVYMPSPLSWGHENPHLHLGWWLGCYIVRTPGCEGADNATWLMLDDVPQPDLSLRILPEFGGKTRLEGRFATGAADFLAEICLSSAAYDLHEKLELYRATGVKEYLAVLGQEQELRWHHLVGDAYKLLPLGADGVFRSVELPGLWLHAHALLDGDLVQMEATLNLGLQTPEHAAFVARLAEARK